jgi:Uma2 family endonuclease
MSMTLTREKLVTAEEFWDYCAGSEEDVELVDGRIVIMPPAGPPHGRYDSKLLVPLAGYVEQKALGEVYLNTGFILRQNPDLIRGPDQAFVTAARIKANPEPATGFWPIAPDLAIEIVSPGNSADDINDKVNDYLEYGVRLIWVIYPRRKQAHVFRPDRLMRVVNSDGKLEGEDVVPGFEVTLSQIVG